MKGSEVGRPSVAEERITEILCAFERCIARFGVEGSTLEKIAAEAGMKRSILRHYVGNREELLEALADRVIAKYTSMFESYLKETSSIAPVDQIMGYLFPAKTVSTTESILVLEALIAASASSPEIRDKMRAYIDWLIERSSELLRQSYPNASKQNCWTVGFGLVSICFNHESLTPLAPPAKYARAAKAAARSLIMSLEDSE